MPQHEEPPALGRHLLEAAERAPGAPYLQSFAEDGRLEVISYADAARGARAVAEALLEQGVRPGEPVAVLGQPGPLQVQALLGVWLAGGVLTPLDPQWLPEAQRRGLIKARARAGLWLPGSGEALAEAADGIEGLILVDADKAAASAPSGRPLPAVDRETPALVLFTSGTTGEPKAAVLRHRALLWNAQAVLQALAVNPRDNLLAVLPLHHVFGLLVVAVLAPLARVRVTFPASLRGPEISRAMRDSGVTLVAAVPQLILGLDRAIRARLERQPAPVRSLLRLLMAVNRVLRAGGVNAGRLFFSAVHRAIGPELRLLGSAGAALDPEAARHLWSLGFTVVEAYGLTESGPTVSVDRAASPAFGSVGFPLAGLELRLLEPDASGSGEIVVRSPSLFDGYLDMPEETAAMLRDGWLHTGDLGRLDGDGRLWITGRRREVIVLGSGKNVYPHEVEVRLDDSPFIQECCVVGLAEAGRRGTEKLHAVVVPDLDAFRSAGESRIEYTLHHEVNRIGDRLPSHHRVSGITVRTEPLPRTPLGKLRRFQVLSDLEAARSGAPPRVEQGAAEVLPDGPGWPVVEAALRRVCGPGRRIAAASNIELDLGLDSLARVEVVAALEELLETKLSEGFGADVLTVSDLSAAVDGLLERGEEAGVGFRDLAGHGGESEIQIWQRRLLRPVGFAVITLLAPPVILLARILWGWRVTGREHLPRGAFLVCPNHGSYLDALVAVMALPLRHRLRFWSFGDYQIFGNPILRVIAWGGRVIRVRIGAGLKHTLEAGGAVLRSGAPLVLFPEGARAPAGQRLVFRRGAAILARALDVPIVPAWFEGIDRLLPREASWPRLGVRIAVRLGEPIDPRSTDAEPDPVQALTDRLRERVLALAEQERSGS